MGKFFVPSAFEKDTKAIKFKTIKGNFTGSSTNSPATKKAKNKNPKGKTSEIDIIQHGKGPIVPKDNAKISKISRVKQGRIEKASKKQQKQKQKLNLKPALSKGAKETLDKNGKLLKMNSNNDKSTASSLREKLKTKLMGGRFRYINEQLYTIYGNQALELFNEDKDAFKAYHEGYRHQVTKWPINPLDRIIKMVRRLPHSLEIVDFGCGEGKLAKSVPNKVISIDLVSSDPNIIACDMANTPLKPESLDVAVYCLSLMGTNLNDFLLEANRVLRMSGFVYIAEIQSRFDNVYNFTKCMEACGFDLIKKDINAKVFYFFQFKKVRNVGKVARLSEFSLKPCLYRKR